MITRIVPANLIHSGDTVRDPYGRVLRILDNDRVTLNGSSPVQYVTGVNPRTGKTVRQVQGTQSRWTTWVQT